MDPALQDNKKGDDTDIVIPMASDNKKKRDSIVPILDLPTQNSFAQAEGLEQNKRLFVRSGSIVSAPPKTPIKKLNQLNDKVNQQKSATNRSSRTTESIARTGGIPGQSQSRRNPMGNHNQQNIPQDNGGTVDQDVPKRNSFLPKVLAETILGSTVSNSTGGIDCYTEEDMWKLLENCNFPLYEFAVIHDLGLEEVGDYAAHMRDLDIRPQVMAEYAHVNCQPRKTTLTEQTLTAIFGDPEIQNQIFLSKQYKKIKKENPENYQVLMLELMKAAYDESEGIQRRSVIADTNTALQKDQLNAKTDEIRLQYLGLIVTVLTAIGGWAFGAFGQISGSSCPTNGTA